MHIHVDTVINLTRIRKLVSRNVWNLPRQNVRVPSSFIYTGTPRGGSPGRNLGARRMKGITPMGHRLFSVRIEFSRSTTAKGFYRKGYWLPSGRARSCVHSIADLSLLVPELNRGSSVPRYRLGSPLVSRSTPSRGVSLPLWPRGRNDCKHNDLRSLPVKARPAHCSP